MAGGDSPAVLARTTNGWSNDAVFQRGGADFIDHRVMTVEHLQRKYIAMSAWDSDAEAVLAVGKDTCGLCASVSDERLFKLVLPVSLAIAVQRSEFPSPALTVTTMGPLRLTIRCGFRLSACIPSGACSSRSPSAGYGWTGAWASCGGFGAGAARRTATRNSRSLVTTALRRSLLMYAFCFST